ncbi:MAG: glycosylase [Deltaproteobacteria bacterium]|nr:glycosylase [Deltaproteobacteria bacterium]MBW2053127.1 glycosylase [Deltaproteobacteria bacterium]MBW2141900.1 glycosylase [Deltaproteobacteria bacterium]MBW2323503.1 glycosylase [Deltaproteobacteria bacterium]
MSYQSHPKWLEDAIFYQIYPQSFYDTNSDGIGDLAGVIEKLDYLSWLGVNAIWLNPCFVSPFQDAGYDVADYYRVAPRYGTNADLTRLFKQAHRRGIKVCLDLVPGHTSIEHPWFKASCRHKRNQYTDRYIWTNSTWDGGMPPLKFINGFAERDGNYAINFFYSQPALNYGFARPNPYCPWQQPVDAPGPMATRAELKKIMDFWLKKGADGFRVDLAASLVKNDPDSKMTIKLWRDVCKWLDQNYPEAALISEWGNPSEALQAGFDIDFMLHFGVPGYTSLFFKGKNQRCFFDSRGGGTVCDFLDEYLKHYRKARKGYISIPSSNHDMPRINNRRTNRDLEVVFAFLMTWPGVPFIYYGDEIGMRYIRGLPSREGGYARTGSRTPMQWDNGKNAGFSLAGAKQLYLPLDGRKNRPTVLDQKTRPTSLLNHVRRLIALRKKSPALTAKGKMEPLFAKPAKYPFIYLRQRGREKFVVALNPSSEPVSAPIEAQGLNNLNLEMGRGVKFASKGKRITFLMTGQSYAVYRAG